MKVQVVIILFGCFLPNIDKFVPAQLPSLMINMKKPWPRHSFSVEIFQIVESNLTQHCPESFLRSVTAVKIGFICSIMEKCSCYNSLSCNRTGEKESEKKMHEDKQKIKRKAGDFHAAGDFTVWCRRWELKSMTDSPAVSTHSSTQSVSNEAMISHYSRKSDRQVDEVKKARKQVEVLGSGPKRRDDLRHPFLRKNGGEPSWRKTSR